MPFKFITDQQLRLHITDRKTHGQRTAAARAGFSERTSRRFYAEPTLPSQWQPKRERSVQLQIPLWGLGDASLTYFGTRQFSASHNVAAPFTAATVPRSFKMTAFAARWSEGCGISAHYRALGGASSSVRPPILVTSVSQTSRTLMVWVSPSLEMPSSTAFIILSSVIVGGNMLVWSWVVKKLHGTG